MTSGGYGSHLSTQLCLTLATAKMMSEAAEAEAARNGWSVVIAIMDAGGHLIHLAKMDGTQYASVEVAQQKGRTAVSFKRPTKALEQVVSGGRMVMLKLPGATPIEGGLPIVVDGQVIGAVGVSGVQSHEDAQIAQAGIDALLKALG